MLSSRRLVLELLESRTLLHAGDWQSLVESANSIPCLVTTSPSNTAIVATPLVSVTAVTAATEDAYENNDTFALAANLGTLSSPKAIDKLVMNDTADWFKFKMNAAGTSSDYAKIAFTHAQGDLDLELFNASGRVISRSQGVTNSEKLSLQNLAAGTYYMRVYGYRGARNPSYSLTIDPGAASAPNVATAAAPGAFDIQLQFQGLTTSEQAIFNQAAARWEQIIVGDLPSAIYNGRVVDDLLIDASAVSIDGDGGTLGQAGPDRFRTGSLFPYHGSMQFDTADLASMERDGSLLSVIEHEIGHILGIGTLWNDLGLITGAGTSNPRFIGQRATAEYNAIFGLHETSVPVENTGGAGTRDAHWRESVFSTEIMTGWAGPGTSLPLSRITIASLADLGYQVDISKAASYSRPIASAALQSSSTTASSSSVAGILAIEFANQRTRHAVDEVMTLWE
ncbi:MAG: leishmanolysin-related zinc metalloendopeptidase [Pirellulaceae bacterium]